MRSQVPGVVCPRHDGQDSLESQPHPCRVCHPAALKPPMGTHELVDGSQ